MSELGYDIDDLYAIEPRPASVTGLGRLRPRTSAASLLCTLQRAFLMYDTAFANKNRDGYNELPDEWLTNGPLVTTRIEIV